MKLMQENHLVENFRAMTNEEMAKSLVASKPLSSMITTTDFEKLAVEMAEWKDEQYAKVLTKLIVELDELKHQVKSLLP